MTTCIAKSSALLATEDATDIQRAYRELVGEFADMALKSGFIDTSELPELTPDDLVLIGRAKPEALKAALLTDVHVECEERLQTKHDRYLEDTYHLDSLSPRDRQLIEFGVARLLK
jgi:hypothetical protein